MKQPFKVNVNSLVVPLSARRAAPRETRAFVSSGAEGGLAPNERRQFEVTGSLDGLQTLGASVGPDAPISFAGSVDWVEGNRLILTGKINAPWTGECRRCAGRAEGAVALDVREIFEPKPTEGETYALVGEVIDLEPMVREAIMLELPTAPICDDNCAGLCPICGINRNEASCNCETETTDIRWAALDAFKDP